MKIRLLMLSCIVIIMTSLCACGSDSAGSIKTTKTIAYTYNVETGDEIIIKLDASDNYSLTSELPFEISQNGKVLSQGTFIRSEYYSMYLENVKNDSDAEIIDSGENDSCEYVMWNYNDSEFNYVMIIKGTNTGLILGNDKSEESAKECFKRLEITIKD